MEDENNKASQALDIQRTNGGDASIKDTAYRVYHEYKDSKHFDGGHYHLGS